MDEPINIAGSDVAGAAKLDAGVTSYFFGLEGMLTLCGSASSGGLTPAHLQQAPAPLYSPDG